MNYRSLTEFVEDLDAAGELIRIAEPVDPVLEVTEIADRVMKQPDGGKALLFTNVKGSDMPLAINLMGSRKRMSMALGVDHLNDIGDRLSGMLKLEVPNSLMGRLAMLPMLKE
ncbi:TPA: menaquinone biosynthesis decarboxylase, partial [Candidatus Latescibacteria bacterium]|nr:menaquinone biosynthesis decarboxylase [Candidatus Latescibacterota bacterium]